MMPPAMGVFVLYGIFELYEVARNCKFEKDDFRECVLPIAVEFVDFSKPEVIKEYERYWKKELAGWDKVKGTQHEMYERVKSIEQNFGKLSAWLADMNSLTAELLSDNNFAHIKQAIKSPRYKR